MSYWKLSKQIDVAAWRDHVRKSVEMLVPGEWDDRGDIEGDLRLRRTELGGTVDGKKSKFRVEVRQRLGYDTVIKPVDSPVPGYNTEYETHEYPDTMDSASGHRNVSFSCEVTAYPHTLGWGGMQVARSEDLDTPYEVAEFVRAAIAGYREGGDEPEAAPEPPAPVPSAAPEPSLVPA